MKGLQDVKARARLLSALRAGKSVKDASAAAGMHRRQAYRWRDRCEDVAAAWPSGGNGVRTEQRRRARERDEASDEIAADASQDSLEESLRLRRVGLEVLEQVARNGSKGDGPRVSAARELVRSAEAAYKARRASDRADPDPARAEAKPKINLSEARARLRG